MQYTDRFGSPLNVGDRVVIAVHNGRSSARLVERTVAGLVPLVPHRDETEPRREYDRNTRTRSGPIEGYYYMRADQEQHMGPTSFFRPANTTPDKLYVLQTYQDSSRWNRETREFDTVQRKQSFDRVMDVVKVPDGA